MKPLSPFAVALKRCREAVGLSQDGLARAAGLPVNSLQNWEQGRSEPAGLAALIALAELLGVSLDTLAGRKPTRRRRKPS